MLKRFRVVLSAVFMTGVLIAATAATAMAAGPQVRAPSFSSSDPGEIVVVVALSHTTQITATGYPAPRLEEFGVLPAGLHFKALGPGRAEIVGTPTITDPFGWRTITIAAWNPAGLVQKNITIITIGAPDLGTICALLGIC
jgi:hypothetical protein